MSDLQRYNPTVSWSDSSQFGWQGDNRCSKPTIKIVESTNGQFVKYAEAADLIEQQQNKIEEYKLKYEGKDLVWFERDEVGELDPNHTGLISLAEVKARQAKETYVETLNEILDMWERGEINSLQDLYDSDAISDRHAEKIRKGKDGE